MTARLSFGRTLAVAGIVAAVAVPLTAGSAFADTKSNHPVPTQTAGQNPSAPTHNTGHHPAAPMHNTGHHPAAPMHNTGHHPAAPMHNTGHHPSTPVHTAGHHSNPISHHDRVTTLRTRTRDAHIQMSPTSDRHGRTVSTLRMRGSKVAVTCYTNGARVNGSDVWFQTVAPARGYISSSDVARPAHPVGRCG